MYDVKEITDQLIINKLIELGANSLFFENPSFCDFLNQIKSTISFAKGKVLVYRRGNGFDFQFENQLGEKKKLYLYCSSPDRINLFFQEDYVRQHNKEIYKERFQRDLVVKLNLSDGSITMEDTHVIIDSNTKDNNKCNVKSWLYKTEYSPEGIEISNECRDHYETINMNYDRYILTNVIDYSGRILKKNCDHLYRIIRNNLDTAKVTYNDNVNNTFSNGVVILSQESGLRKMITSNSLLTSDVPTIIMPLSEEEINSIISKESNPKVQEGLRKYVKDRSKYYYNSSSDPYYRPYGSRK